MRRVDSDPAVRAVAQRMGIRAQTQLAREICHNTIDSLQEEMNRFGMVPKSLDDVLEIVSGLRGIEFVHVENDVDLSRIEADLAKEMPALERQLSFEFRDSTEAVVLRRVASHARSTRRYLAVIDARGHRSAKAWFGDRHEAVHVLLPDDSNQQLFRRTSAERPEPFEQVVDFTASQLGFWPPLVVGPLRAILQTGTDILDAFERTRVMLAPRASMESAFRAFAQYVAEPLLIIWSDYTTRRDGDPSSLALRVRVVIANDAAIATRLFIPDNYRIPAHSVIVASCGAPWTAAVADNDSLERWRDSAGRRLAQLAVKVTARGSWAALQLR